MTGDLGEFFEENIIYSSNVDYGARVQESNKPKHTTCFIGPPTYLFGRIDYSEPKESVLSCDFGRTEIPRTREAHDPRGKLVSLI